MQPAVRALVRSPERGYVCIVRHACFAYGSNMCPEHMRRLCPGHVTVGLARLESWRMDFSCRGYATIGPDPAATTWGVLYELDDAHLTALDEYEEVATGLYTRRLLPVHAPQGQTRAWVYIGTPQPGDAAGPAHRRHVLNTARLRGLPPEHIAQIQKALREFELVARA